MTDSLRVLIFGDVAVPTGFGRIGAAVGKHLAAQGCQVIGACIQYDGLLPPPTGVPFFVAALGGKDHGQTITAIASVFKPHVVLSIQDFPYHLMLREATGIDWSVTGHVVITPVDGAPVAPEWLGMARQFDRLMTISEYGVQTLREAGQAVGLCAPGVDTREFYPLPIEARVQLRSKLGIPAEAYVVGVMAMNQGRKDFPRMIEAWATAFRDVPNAYLYLDCDVNSIAGWRLADWVLPAFGMDRSRVRLREDAMRAGLVSLNERYNLLDQHMVIAHREGFGLPHIEALAAGVPTCALDYCSGSEVTQHGQTGLLIKAHRGGLSSWGGAWDYDADTDDLARQLRWAYDHPGERAAMRERGLEYAKSRTWDAACQAVYVDILATVEKRGLNQPVEVAAPVMSPPPAPLVGPRELAKMVAGEVVSLMETKGNGHQIEIVPIAPGLTIMPEGS